MADKKRPTKRVKPRVTETQHGLTRHLRMEWPGLPKDATPEQAQTFFEGLGDFSETQPTAARVLADLERWAQRVLDEAGLPTTCDLIEIHRDGTWKPVGEVFSPEAKIRYGRVTDLVKDRLHTPPWFAAGILEKVDACRRALHELENPSPPRLGEDGKPKKPCPPRLFAEEAMLAMALATRWRTLAEVKGAWEPDAMAGAASRGGSRKGAPLGAKATAEKKAKEHREIVDAAWHRKAFLLKHGHRPPPRSSWRGFIAREFKTSYKLTVRQLERILPIELNYSDTPKAITATSAPGI